MILLLFVAAGLAAGCARGGRPSHLKEADLRWFWLPILSFLLKGLLQWQDPGAPWEWALCLVQYGLLLAFALLQFRQPWAWFFGLGTLCNALVILLNDGRMPVSEALALQVGSEELAVRLLMGEITGYTLQTAGTRLPWLGDVLATGPLGYASVGDLLLGLGAGMLAYRLIQTQK